jgi:SPOR domain
MKRSLAHLIYSTSVCIVLLLSISCAAQKNGSKPYYHEDLYSLRPKFPEPADSVQAEVHKKGEVVATHNVNKKVDGVLDSINHFNAARKFIDGYTIQIYSGQNREEAMNTKKKMSTDAPDLNAEMEYTQPKFRVRVGSYFSRLDAQKDLLRLRRPFPNAILVPEKILVR